MPAGRPTKYKDEFAKQAKFLCAKGCTDEELASFFEVHVATIYRWKSDHPEFCDAIKIGGAPCDDRVERSLFARATGYTFDAVKIMQHQGEFIEKQYKEHVPPDPTSMIFWLKNRKREEWRDRTDNTTTHDVSDPMAQLLKDITQPVFPKDDVNSS